MAALALVPLTRVIEAYKALIASEFWTTNKAILIPLLNYFEKNYLGRDTYHGFSEPRYSRDKWNQHEAVLKRLARTNNAIEGWHCGFIGRAGCDHPTIWRLIDVIKSEHDLYDLPLVQDASGNRRAAPPQRKRYREANTRLQNQVDDNHDSWTLQVLSAKEMYQYLLNVAMNIHFTNDTQGEVNNEIDEEDEEDD